MIDPCCFRFFPEPLYSHSRGNSTADASLDDMILVQLGTSNPGQTEEEKQEWNAGLRTVLKDLREKNTKDPDVVAAAIAEYRRKFLQDPSRVLNI
jgi:hypothetical protein